MKIALKRKILVIKVAGEMLFLFGLLAWGNGVLIQFIYPMALPMHVSFLIFWMRTDTFTILSFLVSALGFFLWRLPAELTKSEKDKGSDKSSSPSST